MHYGRVSRTGSPFQGAKPVKGSKPCTAEGCSSPADTRGFCRLHYGRWWRKGSVEDFKAKAELPHSGGYVMEHWPGHPLATGRYVYQHRRVYFDAHGSGPFKCHWCGAAQTWETMHVDHLDDVKDHNDASNLVASCPRCNQWRAHDRAVAARRSRGRMITAFGLTRCIAEWARDIGISAQALQFRLNKGWPTERALTEKRGKFGPHGNKPVLLQRPLASPT
jgi:hypothetical protein